MSGWYRIGIVLSILWFIGFDLWLWSTTLYDVNKQIAFELEEWGMSRLFVEH
jgi:hypothetical protein